MGLVAEPEKTQGRDTSKRKREAIIPGSLLQLGGTMFKNFLRVFFKKLSKSIACIFSTCTIREKRQRKQFLFAIKTYAS